MPAIIGWLNWSGPQCNRHLTPHCVWMTKHKHDHVWSSQGQVTQSCFGAVAYPTLTLLLPLLLCDLLFSLSVYLLSFLCPIDFRGALKTWISPIMEMYWLSGEPVCRLVFVHCYGQWRHFVTKHRLCQAFLTVFSGRVVSHFKCCAVGWSLRHLINSISLVNSFTS